MYEPSSGDTKPPVIEPMEMSAAETLLKEAKAILDEFAVVFFLRHGTCLGAVRDGGFIGWDDDLDIGSIIGLHGFTEDSIEPVVRAFRERGFNAIVKEADLHISVELIKLDTPLDWTCYRIVDDSIYQWPMVKIPVELHTDLKPIEFLGEEFNVPNPPRRVSSPKVRAGVDDPEENRIRARHPGSDTRRTDLQFRQIHALRTTIPATTEHRKPPGS